MEEKEEYYERPWNAIKNIVRSRKYFLVFVATILNVYWHHDPFLFAENWADKLEVTDQLMQYELGILGLYFAINTARKHNQFQKQPPRELEENHPESEAV